jgi:hypothetical protein
VAVAGTVAGPAVDAGPAGAAATWLEHPAAPRSAASAPAANLVRMVVMPDSYLTAPPIYAVADGMGTGITMVPPEATDSGGCW